MVLTLKVSFARVINKWLREQWGTKEYRKVYMLEVIYYFNNCFRMFQNSSEWQVKVTDIVP